MWQFVVTYISTWTSSAATREAETAIYYVSNVCYCRIVVVMLCYVYGNFLCSV